MTTVILIGGNDRTAPTYLGERLKREISMRIDKPSVLSCNFAKNYPEERKRSEIAWLNWLQDSFLGCNVEIAVEGEWEAQVAASDVIYLHGGRTRTLLDSLSDFRQSRQLFEGKIVIGSSAGANYLASGGYSPAADEFVEGIGLVDLSVLVHYGSNERASIEDWVAIRERVVSKFKRPIITLSEGEFTIIET